MEKRKRLEEALEKMGIYSIQDLNEAIRKMKPVNISVMAAGHIERRRAG